MTYDKGLVQVDRLTGGALSGWSAITGSSRTGQSAFTREPVDFAAVTINDGYTIGNRGELSLDPATASATLVDFVTIQPGGDPSFGAGPFGLGRFGMAYGGLELPALTKDNRIEISYNGVIVLAGLCQEVSVSFSTSDAALARGAHAERRTTATLASIQRLMLGTRVRWLSLPAEPAIDRLRRWFTVDDSAVTDPAIVNVIMPAEDDPGSTTLLDIARAFSEATRLPVRPPGVLSPDNWPSLEVVVLPKEPAIGLDNGNGWITELEYVNGRPASMNVKTNDTRLADAQASHPVEGEVAVQTGFRVPDRVDAFGRTVTAHRVTQTFGTNYSAQIEVM